MRRSRPFGYGEASPRAAASRLRTQPAVVAAIDVARAALRARCDASADRWLLEVLAISYADPDAKTEDRKPATRLTFGEKYARSNCKAVPWGS